MHRPSKCVYGELQHEAALGFDEEGVGTSLPGFGWKSVYSSFDYSETAYLDLEPRLVSYKPPSLESLDSSFASNLDELYGKLKFLPFVDSSGCPHKDALAAVKVMHALQLAHIMQPLTAEGYARSGFKLTDDAKLAACKLNQLIIDYPNMPVQPPLLDTSSSWSCFQELYFSGKLGSVIGHMYGVPIYPYASWREYLPQPIVCFGFLRNLHAHSSQPLEPCLPGCEVDYHLMQESSSGNVRYLLPHGGASRYFGIGSVTLNRDSCSEASYPQLEWFVSRALECAKYNYLAHPASRHLCNSLVMNDISWTVAKNGNKCTEPRTWGWFCKFCAEYNSNPADSWWDTPIGQAICDWICVVFGGVYLYNAFESRQLALHMLEAIAPKAAKAFNCTGILKYRFHVPCDVFQELVKDQLLVIRAFD
jgi:hypothetical protein